MKKNLVIFAALISVLTACNKSVSSSSNDVNSSELQFISVNKDNDSTFNNILLDGNGYWTKQWFESSSSNQYWDYIRDGQNRIIEIHASGFNDSTVTNVYYSNQNEVAYTILHHVNNSSQKDSIVYEYVNGKVSRINVFSPSTSAQASYYNTYEFSNSNITKVSSYNLQGANYEEGLSYTFEYDNKINPFFSNDDANLLYNWNTASKNNIVKQTNHYGNYGIPDDYVTSEYVYGANNKPVSTKWYGPSIQTMEGYYFYK